MDLGPPLRMASALSRLPPLLGLTLVTQLMHEEEVPRWQVLTSQLEELRRLYKEDQILKADKLLKRLAETVLRIERRAEGTTPLSDEDVAELSALVTALEELAHIHYEALELRRLIEDACDTASWQVVNSSATSMCGKVKAPLLNIIALINEVDLYKTWIPFLKIAEELSGYGIRKIVHVSVDLPWPISGRECLIYGYSADDLDDSGCILVFMRDCTAEDLATAVPVPVTSPLDPKLVRAKLRLAGLLLKPVGPAECEVTMLANVDPCLASLPYWLLNFVTRNAMPLAFSLFSSLAANIEGSEHSKRINKDQSSFYAEVKRRLIARGLASKE